MVEITGVDTRFQHGQTTLGFGTSDIYLRRLWVVGPDRILANVSVAPAATPGSSDVTVATGLRLTTAPLGFQIVAADPEQVIVIPPAVNASPDQRRVYAGATAILKVANLDAPVEQLVLTVGDKPATILKFEDGQITFQVPADLTLGPAIVRLAAGDKSARPIVMNIDPPPPAIISAYSGANTTADADHAAIPGSTLAVLVHGLPDPFERESVTC